MTGDWTVDLAAVPDLTLSVVSSVSIFPDVFVTELEIVIRLQSLETLTLCSVQCLQLPDAAQSSHQGMVNTVYTQMAT